jgi:hypothetical protein
VETKLEALIRRVDAIERLKELLSRAEDVEGMARVMYAHEHEKLGTRWEDEPRSIKSYWRSAARAVSRWLTGKGE